LQTILTLIEILVFNINALGNLQGRLVSAQTKTDYLDELCQTLSIKPERTIAMGDVAND